MTRCADVSLLARYPLPRLEPCSFFGPIQIDFGPEVEPIEATEEAPYLNLVRASRASPSFLLLTLIPLQTVRVQPIPSLIRVTRPSRGRAGLVLDLRGPLA